MRRRLRAASLPVAVLIATTIVSAFAAGSPAPKPTVSDGIIENWPADYGDALDAWRRGEASATHRMQRFVYRGSTESKYWGEGGPPDGTYAVIAMDGGWERGHFVYDPALHVAFYQSGCCTEYASVLTQAPAPPEAFAQRNLSDVRTTLGLRLGDSPARVRSILGTATVHGVRGYPDLKKLSYYTMTTRACGMHQNVYFRRERAVRIEIMSGC